MVRHQEAPYLHFKTTLEFVFKVWSGFLPRPGGQSALFTRLVGNHCAHWPLGWAVLLLVAPT